VIAPKQAPGSAISGTDAKRTPNGSLMFTTLCSREGVPMPL